jgi:hypothetical protein
MYIFIYVYFRGLASFEDFHTFIYMYVFIYIYTHIHIYIYTKNIGLASFEDFRTASLAPTALRNRKMEMGKIKVHLFYLYDYM